MGENGKGEAQEWFPVEGVVWLIKATPLGKILLVALYPANIFYQLYIM